MDNLNNNNNEFNNNNPTEQPGYYNNPQNDGGYNNPQGNAGYGMPQNNGAYNNPQNNNGYIYPKQQQPIKPKKSRFGLGILVGILIMIAAMVLFGIFGLRALQNNPGSIDLDYQEKINLINEYLESYYMGEYDPNDIEDSLAKGLLSGIGDKYAEYYSAEEYQALMSEIAGNYAGVGVSIEQNDDGEIVVYKVFEGTPADEAGIKVGDIFIEAGGETDFETTDDLVQIVRGEPGTTVDVKVKRKDEELSFTLERRQIEIPSIEYEMLDDDIGYIAISSFEVATVGQFNAAIEALEKEGMKSVIMDLRNNPGGDYDSVVAMADRVLPEGVIISTKDKDGNVKSENSDEANKLTIPIVVLVNENSASAAELFTGALQDYGIATVVGTVTYGKGVVQSIFSLPDGSGMKFTTEKYFTPAGRDINGEGIKPDVEIELPEDAYEDGELDEDEDTQLQKAIEILTEE